MRLLNSLPLIFGGGANERVAPQTSGGGVVKRHESAAHKQVLAMTLLFICPSVLRWLRDNAVSARPQSSIQKTRVTKLGTAVCAGTGKAYRRTIAAGIGFTRSTFNYGTVFFHSPRVKRSAP
jgi:hypothetical protein